MKLLVACERTGIVRDAFIAEGHDAISCDILPSDAPGPHMQCDVRDVLYDQGWDMMIAFPDCTFLSSSGLHRNKSDHTRSAKTEAALSFVRTLMDAPVRKIAIENPVGRIGTRIRKPDQIIQPYQFGHDASKMTCLWLKNLPPLKWTKLVEPRNVNGDARWANQTDRGDNKLGPSTDRAAIRAVTYPGIAMAMAKQWGKL